MTPKKDRPFEPRICENCFKEYTPTNGRQKYCPHCSPAVQYKERAKLPKDSYTLALHGKIKTSEAQRIENLGKLNDDHRMYLERRDRAGLLALAQEYLLLHRPCKTIARIITEEAQSIK